MISCLFADWSVVTVVSTLVRRERMSSCGREPIFAEKKCRDPLSYLLVLIVMSFLMHLKLTWKLTTVRRSQLTVIQSKELSTTMPLTASNGKLLTRREHLGSTTRAKCTRAKCTFPEGGVRVMVTLGNSISEAAMATLPPLKHQICTTTSTFNLGPEKHIFSALTTVTSHLTPQPGAPHARQKMPPELAKRGRSGCF